MPNRFTPIQPNTPEDQKNSIINNNFAQLDNENVKKIYNGADGVPRIYIDGTTGVIKTAPVGVDVTTALDSQLNFNSAQRSLKIAQSGDASLDANITIAGGNVNVTIPHNLGFAPIPLVFLTNGVFKKPLPTWGGLSASAGNILFNTWMECATDETNLEISFIGGSAANYGTWTFKYYLLQETAS